MTYNFTSKNEQNFYCEFCNFKCIKKGDFNRHLNTAKHQKMENTYQKNIFTSNDKKFICDCGKSYSIIKVYIIIKKSVLLL